MGLQDGLKRSMKLASVLIIDVESRDLEDAGLQDRVLLYMADANLSGLFKLREPMRLHRLGSVWDQVLQLYYVRYETDERWGCLLNELSAMKSVQVFTHVYDTIFPDDIPHITNDGWKEECNVEFMRHMCVGVLKILKESMRREISKEHIVDLYDMCDRPGIDLPSYWAEIMHELPFAKVLAACELAYSNRDVDDYSFFLDTVLSVALDHEHDPPEDFLSLPASMSTAGMLGGIVFEDARRQMTVRGGLRCCVNWCLSLRVTTVFPARKEWDFVSCFSDVSIMLSLWVRLWVWQRGCWRSCDTKLTKIQMWC